MSSYVKLLSFAALLVPGCALMVCAQQQGPPLAPTASCSFGWNDYPGTAGPLSGECPAPVFAPGNLALAGPGTYSRQYLGKLIGFPISGNQFFSSILGGVTGITVANLTLSPLPPDGSAADGSQYVYGDVTVANPLPVAAGLLLSFYQANTQVLSAVDVVTIDGSPTAGCPVNATANVQITVTPAVQLFGSDLWTGLVTIKNTSSITLTGPIELSLSNLSANAGLFGAAGVGVCAGNQGQPYQFVASHLAPGASVSVMLSFTNSLVPSSSITYTPTVLVGGSRI